jgi:hypothetical protein
LLKRSFVTGATLVFDARFKEQILPIPDHLRYLIHDRWIATIVAAYAEIAFSSIPSMLYRQHHRQQIGAREKAGPVELVLSRIPRLREALFADLENARAIAARLGERPRDAPRAPVRREIRERVDLLEMRARLPDSRQFRIIPIGRALFSGLYHRHASGFGSAAKDLLL